MLIDSSTMMSDDQAITADAASTFPIIQPEKGQALGQPVYWVVQCTESLNNCTTIAISLRCHEDSGMSTGTKTLIGPVSFAVADVTANKILIARPVPPGAEKYIDTYYDITGGTQPSTGKFKSFFTVGAPIGDIADA